MTHFLNKVKDSKVLHNGVCKRKEKLNEKMNGWTLIKLKLKKFKIFFHFFSFFSFLLIFFFLYFKRITAEAMRSSMMDVI